MATQKPGPGSISSQASYRAFTGLTDDSGNKLGGRINVRQNRGAAGPSTQQAASAPV